ncbi:MAG TPA: thioredoxin domain-containing protein [Candidatus Polarisedimenticolia bacterium]|nr:thioredoxin domain-containing protein [Candidatus Polarisedimenticolia bacterium]
MKAFSSLLILLSLICLNCASQPKPTDLTTRIERQIRATYKLPPEAPVVVGPFSPSPDWPGYDAFTVTIGEEGRKQDYPFLLAKDKKSIVRVNRIELSADPYRDVMKKIDVRGRPVRGAKQSKVVLVAYDDLQCPFCTMMHQILFPELLKEYGDRVTFVYKDFPLPNHAWASHAAVDANCLAAQNEDAYWSFVDSVHASQREINGKGTQELRLAELDRIAMQQGADHKVDAASLQACVKTQNDAAIKAAVHEGESIGVDSTPTLFINGEEMSGGVAPLPRLRAALDRALKNSGTVVPTAPQTSPKN